MNKQQTHILKPKILCDMTDWSQPQLKTITRWENLCAPEAHVGRKNKNLLHLLYFPLFLRSLGFCSLFSLNQFIKVIFWLDYKIEPCVALRHFSARFACFLYQCLFLR